MSANKFAEYTRSSAFRLELSEAMIDALLHLYIHGHPNPYRNFQSYESLARRGLVEWIGTDIHPKARPLQITAPGRTVVQLLMDAGYYSPAETRQAG